MIKEYNFDEFDKASRQKWNDKLIQDLGAELADRISTWNCERELPLSAYYDETGLNENLVNSSRAKTEWKYLDLVNDSSSADQIMEKLMNGADGLLLGQSSIQKLDQLLNEVKPQHCTLAICTSNTEDYKRYIDWLNQKHPNEVEDELLLFHDLRDFSSMASESHCYFLEKSFELGRHNHRTINIDCGLVNRKGGGAALELSYLLSQSVFYINHFLSRGYPIEKIVSRFFVSTAVGSSFFLELAKIRVMRFLLSQVFNQYGLSHPNVPIHASTSSITKSILDSNTNFLRCTSEAMSAVLGGVDYLSINPNHDLPFADRTARNISNLLKEESYFSKIADPSAGSYYVESLSKQLAKTSWEMFQQLEADGGFEAAIVNNWFQTQIDKDVEFHKRRLESGHRKMVGVNDFGNPDEQIKPSDTSRELTAWSEDFEKVRMSVESFVDEKGEKQRPIVYLTAVGTNAKMINARYTFVTNFFNWAGFKVKKLDISEPLSELNVVVCCGADEDYTSVNIDKVLGAIKPPGILLAAGRGNVNSSDRIEEWINVKSNRLTTVIDALSHLGFTLNQSVS